MPDKAIPTFKFHKDTPGVIPYSGERHLSLFDIEHEKADLIAFRDECESDEERAAVDKQIQEYVGREIRKVTGIAKLLQYFKSMGEAAKAERERAAKHQARWERAHERLKAMVLSTMQAMDIPKLEAATDRFRRQKNPVALEITDAAKIHVKYLRATIKMPFVEWRALLDAADAAGIAPVLDTLQVASEVDTATLKAACAAKVECGECHGSGRFVHPSEDGLVNCRSCDGDGTVAAIVPGARLIQGEHLRVE